MQEAETIRKKILFLASTLSHIRNFHLPYLKAFKEQGYEVWVAAGSSGEVPYADHVIELPFYKRFFCLQNLIAVFQARKLMKRERFDILSAHTTLAGAVTRAAALLLLHRPKVFYTCHGYLFSDLQGLKKWAYLIPEKICSLVTDVLMTMNQEDYELAKRHHLACGKLVSINGMGIDYDRFAPYSQEKRNSLREQAGFQENEVLFIYAAEFSKRKNQQMLIHAFAKAVRRMPKARLLLAGAGQELQACRSAASTLHIDHKVQFLGQVDDMAALYPLCDVVVTTSRSEGLPFHLMEAMACGLPAAASDVKGHRDLVQDGKTGYLFDAEREDLLVEKLIKLYKIPNLREKFGANARERAADFALARVMPQILSIYGIEKPKS